MEQGKRKIAVHNEWDTLREAVVGIEDDTVEPEYVEALVWLDEEGKEKCRKYGGRRTASYDPDKVEKIREQLDNHVKNLEKCGVKVHRTRPMVNPAEKEFLNCVQRGNMLFGGADFFRVIGEKVLLLNSFRLPFRRKQVFMVRPLLEELLGEVQVIGEGEGKSYVCTPPPSPHYNREDLFLENGDIMCDGKNVYVGMSGNASSMAGVAWLKAFLGPEYKVRVIPLKKDHFHLDWALTLNKPGVLTYCEEALEGGVAGLERIFPDWRKIRVNPKDTAAANILTVDCNTVIVSEQDPLVIKEYESCFTNVIVEKLDVTIEFGSGPRCLTAVLRRDP